LVSAAGLVPYVVVTWFRDDDALAAGVLFALTFIVGSLAAIMVMGVIITQSITSAIALLTFSPVALLFWSVFLIPIFTILIWLARKISALLERAVGTAKR
jgi:hypothetical protein